MATSISSSLVAYSNIQQQPAKFNFPIKFPLCFAIQNYTNSISDSANVVANSTLTGQMLSIIPIVSNCLSSSSIGGTLNNAINFLVPTLSETSSMGTPIVNNSIQLTGYEATINLFTQPTSNSGFTVMGNGTFNVPVYSPTDIEYRYNYSQNQIWTYHGFDIPVTVGAYYTLSFDVYISTDSNLTGSVMVFGCEQGYVNYPAYNCSQLGTWQHFNITFAPTGTNQRLLMYPCASSTPTTTGYVQYRNIQFEQKQYETPFTIGTRSEGRVLETSNITGISRFTSYILGSCNETSLVNGITTLGSAYAVGVVSNSNISSTSSLSSSIVGNVPSSTTITGTITFKPSLIPQTINATGTVTGIPTAIFTLVTNIVANTSIAITVSIAEGINGNIIGSSNITGNLINLVNSNVIAISNINNTFTFPLNFPFMFSNPIQANTNIKGGVVSTSSIVNSGVLELLSINLNSNSSITGTLTCTLSEQSTITESTSIGSNITSKLGLNSTVTETTSLTGNINEQVSICGSVNSTSGINGVITATLIPLTSVVVNTNLVANVATQFNEITNLNSSSIINANIIETATLNALCTVTSSINSALSMVTVLNGGINVTENISEQSIIEYNEQYDLVSNSLITGNALLLIGGNVNVSSNIGLLQTFSFPMTFPLTFNNNIIKALPISGSVIGLSQITANSLVNLIGANVQSNSSIVGTLQNKGNIQGQLIETSDIELGNEIDNISLSSDLTSTLSATSTIFDGVLIRATINATTNSACLSKIELDCQSNLVSSSTISGNLINLISSNLNVVSNISLPQTFGYPLTFPLVFINEVTKGLALAASPIIAASDITSYICNAIGAGINATSSINGTVKNTAQLNGSVAANTAIADASFTGLIPMGCNVKTTSTISGTLVLSSKLNSGITCTSLIPNIFINEKNVETFVTNLAQKTIIPKLTSNALYSVNTLKTSNFEPNLIQVESFNTNLQAKGIFYCNQNLNVTISKQTTNVTMTTDLIETVVVKSNILNTSIISNAEFIKNLNYTSYKEE